MKPHVVSLRWSVENGGRRYEFLIADLPESDLAAFDESSTRLPAEQSIRERRDAYRGRKGQAKRRTEHKAKLLVEVAHRVAAGAGRIEAAAQVSAAHGVSERTIRRWAAETRHVTRTADLAPVLADNYKPRVVGEPSWTKPLLRL